MSSPGRATGPEPITKRKPILRIADGWQPSPLAFTLLGGFSVSRSELPLDRDVWQRRAAQRLVRFLLVHKQRAVSRDELIEAFWPESPLDKALGSLRVAISAARKVLDTPGTPTVIDLEDRIYRLRLRDGDRVDVDDFVAAAHAALAQRGGGRVDLLERAESLWGGEPLPEERYADWARSWSERLVDLYASVLAALADESIRRGDLLIATVRARELLEIDPLNEGAHRRLMVAYSRAGRRSHALRQFLKCRHALVEELGVEPAVETSLLQERILAGQPV